MSELQYAALLVLLLVFGAARISYKIGYDQGRNDGFHQGWREAMQVKELPEPPAEDE